mmetsp:Transcript_24554/g.40701  ORF Transcript_24554/g.40701 Transcript_24554/m.40701 type:complete len:87 (+) Transcript_24554:355-615(+)
MIYVTLDSRNAEAISHGARRKRNSEPMRQRSLSHTVRFACVRPQLRPFGRRWQLKHRLGLICSYASLSLCAPLAQAAVAKPILVLP